ncbi:MAG: DUF1223 domain-containing protein [Hyphomicrobiales bacterium]|nr:DUF1223 domain-containing protein [Hyphomicrobiales bacterium]
MRTLLKMGAGTLAMMMAGAFGQSSRAADGNLSKPVVVLELFTSQGCSSCPPADALLETYIRQDNVVALSFPVDYWDRLGWKDTFAKKEHTVRQYAYATARGDGQVYTPQIVVNGVAHAVGSSSYKVDAAISSMKRAMQAQQVSLDLQRNNDGFTVKAGAAPSGSKVSKATLLLAVVQDAGKVAIGNGENGGRKVTYFNVVRALKPIGNWSGDSMAVTIPKKDLPLESGQSVAVLLQDGGAGPIIGAAHLKSPAGSF